MAGGASAQGDGVRTSLEARAVTVDFQALRAVDSVDLSLERGEILGLIGPNGAGKTTLVNVLTGFQAPSEGRVVMGGSDIDALPPHQRARRGIARTFQNVRLFAGLTVLENVESGAIAMGLDRASARRRAREILERLGLADAAHRRAGDLPFGEERRVGIGRAIAMQPQFLLMDEPAAGLNDSECDELGGVVARIRDEVGCGILLIEHRMSIVFALCDRIQVLEQGRTIALGPPEAIRGDAGVRRAYLGDDAGQPC
jgi:branched-chain amino acid transport system ATP-binding protein